MLLRVSVTWCRWEPSGWMVKIWPKSLRLLLTKAIRSPLGENDGSNSSAPSWVTCWT